MIRSIARLAVRNPVAANLAMLAICACGLLAYQRMPREVFPDFSLGMVEVRTNYPGAAPEDVERLVTGPLEEAIEGIDGLREMSSTSREGFSRIALTLEEDGDMGEFLEAVRSAVTRGDVELPSEVEEPFVHERKNVFPVISVFVYGWASEAEMRRLADMHRRGLEGLAGVREVRLTGMREPRIWIELDPLALERHGLSQEDVGRAVSERAQEGGGGKLDLPSGQSLLRVGGELQWARDLASLPVLVRPGGDVVRLADVATLSDTFERGLTRARFNGQPCLHMQVNKHADGDAIDIAQRVRAYVQSESALLPAGTALGLNADLSVYVANRLSVMWQSGSIGAVLVLIALVLFLEWRVALVTALGIPVAFLGGILLASSLGVTMNMISMFGLIVVLGMIVDDAIVVGENAYRLMEEGMSPREAAIEGTAQVGPAVLATILTSIVAFLPVLMLKGHTGLFMRPLPLITTLCLVVSLFQALTILPVHLAHWTLRLRPDQGASGKRRRWYEPLRAGYLQLLRFCLRWRYLCVVAALCGGALLIGLARYRIPFVFFADFESKIFYVNVRTSPGNSLDETELLALEVERIALELPATELESVNTLLGVSASDTSNYELGQNLAQVWVELREGAGRTLSTPQVIELLRSRLHDLPAGILAIEIDQPQSGPTGRAIEISVRGTDLAVLEEISERLQTILAQQPGVRDVHDNLERGKREVLVKLTDHARILGLSEGEITRQLHTAYEGRTLGHVRRGRDDVELVLKYPEAERMGRERLGALRVRTPAGERLPLREVAELMDRVGPSVITHDERERSVRVIADVNKAQGNAAEIGAVLAARWGLLAENYPGYRLEFAGEYEKTAESMAGLLSATILTLLLIYLILGTLFGSFTQPGVIMFIIPFGACGGIIGHWILGLPIGLMSLIGLLALTGIVVNDSLILVEFINARRREGAALVEALIDGGKLRFRPILLTSVTTMLGLTPLTFFTTGQARFLQPMAVSIFFGLLVSTLLVLVLVPCAYHLLCDLLSIREVLSRRRKT